MIKKPKRYTSLKEREEQADRLLRMRTEIVIYHYRAESLVKDAETALTRIGNEARKLSENLKTLLDETRPKEKEGV